MSHAPITPVSTYVNIFVALLVLTGATYVVATFDFGVLNTPIALAVAILKASLVVIYFMGVRYNTPLTKVMVISGFFWLIIMFGLTLNDYLTRDWIGVAGR
jgi:cytochrome c oxidase subunit 4